MKYEDDLPDLNDPKIINIVVEEGATKFRFWLYLEIMELTAYEAVKLCINKTWW